MRTPLLAFGWMALLATAAVAQPATRPATQPAQQTIPQAGSPAPAIAIVDCGTSLPLQWRDFSGTPVVLQFGSLSDPIFRRRQAMMEKLADFYAGRVRFLIIYTREAHPQDESLDANTTENIALPQPADLEGRLENARKAIVTLNLKYQRVLADSWNNETARKYGGYPNSAFLIDKKLAIAASYPWTDPNKIRRAIDELLAGKPISVTNLGPVRAPDMPIANMEDMGEDQRGLGAAIRILDRTDLTDHQRNKILPALARFAASARNLRERKDGKENQEKGISEADLLKQAREHASQLRDVLKETLPPATYAEVDSALSTGPIGRLFATSK